MILKIIEPIRRFIRRWFNLNFFRKLFWGILPFYWDKWINSKFSKTIIYKFFSVWFKSYVFLYICAEIGNLKRWKNFNYVRSIVKKEAYVDFVYTHVFLDKLAILWIGSLIIAIISKRWYLRINLNKLTFNPKIIYGKNKFFVNSYIYTMFYFRLLSSLKMLYNYLYITTYKIYMYIFKFLLFKKINFYRIRWGQRTNNIFLLWRPIFKKWSYFGVYKTYKSKWMWRD